MRVQPQSHLLPVQDRTAWSSSRSVLHLDLPHSCRSRNQGVVGPAWSTGHSDILHFYAHLTPTDEYNTTQSDCWSSHPSGPGTRKTNPPRAGPPPIPPAKGLLPHSYQARKIVFSCVREREKQKDFSFFCPFVCVGLYVRLCFVLCLCVRILSIAVRLYVCFFVFIGVCFFIVFVFDCV